MQNLFIHIGYYKTGTTSIQYALAHSSDKLRAEGIIYPQSGRGRFSSGTAHHNLAYEHGERFANRERFRPDEGDLNACLAEIDGARCRTAIISSEAFSFFTEAEARLLANRLTGRPVTILVYLRRQDLWLHSGYNQKARFGRVGTGVDLFIREKLQSTSYVGIIRAWQNAFGAEKVRHFLLEKKIVGVNVVEHFARQCGITTLLGESDVRRNARAPLKALIAARYVQGECEDALGMRYELSRNAAARISEFFRSRSDLMDSYSLFNLDHARDIMAYYQADNEQLYASYSGVVGCSFSPLMAVDYPNYVEDPLAYFDHLDNEERAFIAKLKETIVRHHRAWN